MEPRPFIHRLMKSQHILRWKEAVTHAFSIYCSPRFFHSIVKLLCGCITKSSFTHVTDDETFTHQTAGGYKKRKVNQQWKRWKKWTFGWMSCCVCWKKWRSLVTCIWCMLDKGRLNRRAEKQHRNRSSVHTHTRTRNWSDVSSSFVEWKMLRTSIYSRHCMSQHNRNASTCTAWLLCRKERGEKAQK